MKRLALVLLVLLAASSASAQQAFMRQSLTAVSATCPDAGCMIQDVQGLASAGIQITGTWTQTIQFEQSIDGTTFTTWAVTPNGGGTAVTSTTANGLWFGATAGSRFIRVRVSAFTSGTAVVSSQLALARFNGSPFPWNGPLNVNGNISCVPANCALLFPATGSAGVTSNGTLLQLLASDGGGYAGEGVGFFFINSAALQLQNAGTTKWQWLASTATDGRAVTTNAAGTAGVGWDVSTDGTLLIRGRAFAAGTGNVDIGGKIHPGSFVFANIGTVLTANGDMAYCSDCTIANPCAGAGTGSFAKRLNGVNVCN